jgi:hypothetical protein
MADRQYSLPSLVQTPRGHVIYGELTMSDVARTDILNWTEIDLQRVDVLPPRTVLSSLNPGQGFLGGSGGLGGPVLTPHADGAGVTLTLDIQPPNMSSPTR